MSRWTCRLASLIASVRAYGAVVVLFLDADEGRVLPVVLEHRAFRHLLEGAGCEPDDLLGRSVSFEGGRVAFLD
jgi:hypothetical protein